MSDGDRTAITLESLEQPEGLGNREMGWGSDVLAEMIQRIGFKYICITPGASYRGLHDSLVNYLGNRDPQMIMSVHEDATIAIAHGWAKVTDTPMAVALHSNVGLMHAVKAIHNAWCDRAPMFIIGATGNVDAADRRPWIEWIHTTRDQAAIVRHNLKWDDQPTSVAAATESFLRAAKITQTAPKGPVYVCLDVALQEDALECEPILPDAERYRAPAALPVAEDSVRAAAELLKGAKQPAIMIGRCSRDPASWDARVRLAEILGAGVITNSLSPAAFPNRHKQHIGWPETRLSDEQSDYLRDADVILNLDLVDFAGSMRTLWPDDDIPAKIIHCSAEAHNHNGFSMDYQGLAPADLTLMAEPDTIVPALLNNIGEAGRKSGLGQIPARPAGAETKPPRAEGAITLRDLAG
ncbi:MAG: thiamine pyrophosphate-binding protein, partial [Alphaproteobacteria bacterium]